VIALLMSLHCALRAIEGDGDLLLGGITSVDQEHHRIRRGHCVLDTVVVHGKSRHHDDAVLVLSLQDTARVDAADARRHRWWQR
jgi:hypothetical protein